MKPSVYYSHISALLFNAFLTLTTGIFLNDYLLRIGFDEYDFGILFSLYYLTGIIAFPFSFFANSIKRKKAFYVFFHFLSLVFFLIFIAAPYIPGAGSRLVVWLSILSMGLFYILTGIGRLVLIPWMYRVVGSEKWAKFFLVRLTISYAIPILVVVGFGGLLKIEGIHVLSGLLLLALALGLFAVVSMMLFPSGNSDEYEEKSNDKFFIIFSQMVKYPGFVAILLYSALLSFGIGLFTPIVYPYLLSGVGIESSTISMYQLIMTITSIGSTFYISRICERRGSITALVWISSALWTVPVVLILIPYWIPVFTGLLFAFGVADGYGIVFTGTFIVLMNITLQHTPQKNKTVYLAFIEFTKALFMSAGSYLSGWIAKHSGEINIGPYQMNGFRIVFIISLMMMAAGFIMALRLKFVLREDKRVDPREFTAVS